MKKLVFSLFLLVIVFGSIPVYADQITDNLSVSAFTEFHYKNRGADKEDFYLDRIRLVGEWNINEEFLMKVQGDYRDSTRAVRLTEGFISFTSKVLPECKFQAGRVFVMTGSMFSSPQKNPFIGYPPMNKEWCDITALTGTWSNQITTFQLALANEEDKFDGRYEDVATYVSQDLGDGFKLSVSAILSDSQHLFTGRFDFPVWENCIGKIVVNSDTLAHRRGRYAELVWADDGWEIATSYAYESSVDASNSGRLAVSRIFQDGKFPLKFTAQVNFDENDQALWVRVQVPISQ